MADVTVVIAHRNHGALLGEAVGSALSQSGVTTRVVVVDDGSTEASAQAALDALPPEVEVLRQANAGPAAARNRGLAGVATPYVMALDADDRLPPGALRTLRAVLEDDPRIGFAYGRMRLHGDVGGVLRFPPYSAFTLLHRHTIGLSALMRREVVEATGGFDPAFAFEDWEHWISALAHGFRGRQVDAVTLEYRRSGSSKQLRDRRVYRTTYRQLRAKHAALYERSAALAAQEGVPRLRRLVHERWWGPRPLPAALESALIRAGLRARTRLTQRQ